MRFYFFAAFNGRADVINPSEVWFSFVRFFFLFLYTPFVCIISIVCVLCECEFVHDIVVVFLVVVLTVCV